jgi:hypothetical protein
MLEHLVVRGYTPQSGIISPEGVFCLHIPKNASTFITNFLVHNGWRHSNASDPEIKQQIVVLRDPLERWVSGFATYAASWILGPSYGSDNFSEDFNDLSERLIFDQIIFDDHTTPQVQFIEQLNKNIPTTYFALNHDLVTNLKSFLGKELDWREDLNSNITENNYDTKQVASKMKFTLSQNPAYTAKVVDCYRQDYDFIKSVNFYNYYNESR